MDLALKLIAILKHELSGAAIRLGSIRRTSGFKIGVSYVKTAWIDGV